MNPTNVGSIEYDARIDTHKMRGDAREAESIAGKTGDKIGNALASAGKIAAIGIAAAGAASIAFGVKSVKAFTESQDAISQVNATLAATKGVAGVTSQAAIDLASSLQRVTRFSDEQILSGENLLLTFTNIGKDIFPRATKAMLDMSTTMGQDTSQSAIQLGKALQSPMAGMAALSRTGALNRDDMDKLKAKWEKVGTPVYQQQIELLEALEKQFKGSSEAAGKTFAGSIDILKNRFGDFQESIGSLIVTRLQPFAQAAAGAATALTDWADSTAWDTIDKKAGQFLAPIAKAVNSIGDAFKAGGLGAGVEEMIKQLSKLKDAVSTVLIGINWGGVINSIVNGFIGAVGSMNYAPFSKALTDLMVGLFMNIDFAGLTARLVPILFKAAVQILTGFVQGILQWVIADPLNFIGTMFSLFFMPARFVKAIGSALSKIPIFGTLFTWLFNAIAFIPQKLGEPIRKWFDEIGTKMMGGIRGGLSTAWHSVGSFIMSIPSRILGLLGHPERILLNFGGRVINGLTSGIRGAAGNVWGAVKSAADQIGQFFAGAGGWLFNTGRAIIMGLVNGIKSAIGAVRSTLGDLTSKLTSWKGPLSVDKILLEKSGQVIIGGFIKGLESQYSRVQSSLGNLTESLSLNSNITAAVSPSVGSINAMDGIASPRSSTNNTVTIQLNMAGIMARSRSDLRDISKDMVRALNEELKAKGVQPIGGGAI